MNHASLFSGIGGPEVAAAMLGWTNIFHCEINPFGRKILDFWFPESESYEDITKTDFTQYRGQVDVLTGGFPCQPFSYAGKRGGQTDDRYLWPEMLRAIDEIRPTWVIGENVAGITTMVESCETVSLGSETSLFSEDSGIHRFQSRLTFTIERICRDLESKGYAVQPILIPACGVGAPHRRDRVFIIAYNSDCGHDLRETGEYGSKEAEERLSEWNEVRKPGESDNVRSEVCDTSSDSDSWRGSEMVKHLQSKLTDGAEPFCNGGIRDASDSECERLERQNESRCCERRERMHIWGNSPGCRGEDLLRPEERWKAFPTVSSVYRGNDGIPFDVDSLTISFAKWRNESLKAYGNAIVPQVMYRIFQCIEKTEQFETR